MQRGNGRQRWLRTPATPTVRCVQVTLAPTRARETCPHSGKMCCERLRGAVAVALNQCRDNLLMFLLDNSQRFRSKRCLLTCIQARPARARQMKRPNSRNIALCVPS